ARQGGGGAEVLVAAGEEGARVLAGEGGVALEVLVAPAERRSAVPRDQRRGVEAAATIRAMLVEREPNQGLNAGEEDAASLEPVLGFEGEVAGRLHGRLHINPLDLRPRSSGRSPATRKGPTGPSPLYRNARRPARQ